MTAAKVDLKDDDAYRAHRGEFRTLTVPERSYLAVDGHGDPNTDAFAVGILDLGFTPGDRAVVYAQNIPQFVIAQLGIWKAGGIAVSANPMYRSRELAEILVDSGATVLVAMQSLYRDVVMLQFRRDGDIINLEIVEDLRALAATWSADRTLTVLDHIAETREALEQNVQPTLALESLLVTVVSGRKP